MSAVINAITSVASTVIDAVLDVLTVVWDEILQPVLRDIAALFGIENKDVIHTNVNSQRIIDDDDTLKDTIVKLALQHQVDPENTVISKLTKITSASRGRYNSYFEKGKNKFIDGLPDVRIKTTHVDKAKVKEVIDSVYSIDCVITYADIHVPTKYEYVGFVLQEDATYNYRVWDNTLMYNGTYGVQTYILDIINYNYTNDNYDVSISAHETQTTQNSNVIVITISDGDDAEHDNKNTKVYSRVLVTGDISGVVSDTWTLESETDEQIDKGSESDSTTETVDSTTKEYNVTYDVYAFTVDSYVPNLDYVVKYYTTSNTEWKYWVYDESTDVYSTLAYEFNYITNLDMLPVITIRNNFVNTNEDTTTVRYEDSRDMMNVLGIDIDTFTEEINKNPDIADVADVFVHFGLSFTETSEIASKLFFDMFSVAQSDTIGGEKYSITFQEGTMNMAIAWTDMTAIVYDGVLGAFGYAEHEVIITGSDTTVKVRKQTGTEQYTEIVMHNMSNVTFIDRQGLWGTVNTSADSSDFFMPISQYHVSKYSGLEQMELMVISLRTTQYAAVIEHIKWYQTGAFAIFLQVLAVVVVVAGCIYSACTAAILAEMLFTLVATTLALKFIFAHTHNPWLRGLAVVIAAVVSGQLNGFSNAGVFVQAATLTTMVSEFVNIYTADQTYKLQGKKTAFDSALQDRMNSLKEKQRALYAEAKVTVQDMTAMVTQVDPIQYMKTTSVDYMMYVARDIQYDFGILYDYDIMVKDFYNQKLSLR